MATPTGQKLATFNVNPSQWEKFKSLASQNGQSASYWLNVLIDRTIEAGGLDMAPVAVSPVPATDQKLDGVYIQLGEFADKLQSLEQELAEVKKSGLAA